MVNRWREYELESLNAFCVKAEGAGRRAGGGSGDGAVELLLAL